MRVTPPRQTNSGQGWAQRRTVIALAILAVLAVAVVAGGYILSTYVVPVTPPAVLPTLSLLPPKWRNRARNLITAAREWQRGFACHIERAAWASRCRQFLGNLVSTVQTRISRAG